MENISKEQGGKLLKLARAVIDKQLGGGSHVPQLTDKSLLEKRGTFVTLKVARQLRGCIGNITPVKSIRDGISDNAFSAAFNDHRFSPLSREEFYNVHISISILSEPQKLNYRDGSDLLAKLTPNTDGVILRKGSAGATFLPQVWEQLPDAGQFLSQLCLKAGLAADSWKETDLEILVYQVQSFEEDGE